MSNARKLAANLPSIGSFANRNAVINGSMAVAQRGSVPGLQTGYGACDRFKLQSTSAARFDTTQSTDVPSGQGFSNSLKLDCSTADTSLASGDYYFIMHQMEGLNLQHLKYGTSDAVQCTLSFWVKSPKTGIHNVEIEHVDGGKFNTHQYTIASANTWQKVSFTFDGNTAASIVNDGTCGMLITWWLQAGSAFTSGTHTSGWFTGNSNRAVGQVNVSDSTSNNFYLTGVQLEVGGKETPFEHEQYETTLRKCQRYFYKVTGTPGGKHIGSVVMRDTQYFYGYPRSFPTPMRIPPTMTYSGVRLYVGDHTNGFTTMTLAAAETDAFSFNGSAAGAVTAAETGHTGLLYMDTTSSNHATFDSEL